jgi:hypothetical protein
MITGHEPHIEVMRNDAKDRIVATVNRHERETKKIRPYLLEH